MRSGPPLRALWIYFVWAKSYTLPKVEATSEGSTVLMIRWPRYWKALSAIEHQDPGVYRCSRSSINSMMRWCDYLICESRSNIMKLFNNSSYNWLFDQWYLILKLWVSTPSDTRIFIGCACDWEHCVGLRVSVLCYMWHMKCSKGYSIEQPSHCYHSSAEADVRGLVGGFIGLNLWQMAPFREIMTDEEITTHLYLCAAGRWHAGSRKICAQQILYHFDRKFSRFGALHLILGGYQLRTT